MTSILFILGPSGAGKSTLGRWISEHLGFHHLEIDRWPETDGIDAANLRPEWEAFLTRAQADPLAAAVRARVAPSRGAVLTFPGLVVLSAEQLSSAKGAGIQVIVPYGTQVDCLHAFLRREKESGRGLDERHWLENNASCHARFGESLYAPYRVLVFEDGQFRNRSALLSEMRRRADFQ